MINILYGLENGLIEQYIKKLKEEENIENEIKYNLNENTLEEIIQDASYLDMFGNKKMIIAYSFLDKEEDLSLLEKYYDNKNENTILIFISNKEKLDERKKIIKKFKQDGLLKEFNKLTEVALEDNVLNMFKKENFNIDLKSIRELINRCKNNYSMIKNEVEKLMLYKIEEKNITYEDIIEVVNKPLEDDIFKLLNAISLKNKQEIFKIYNDILSTGEDPIKIIVMMANEFRMIYQVKILYKSYTEKEIASILKIHPYRIKLAVEKSRQYDINILKEILNKLSDLDLNIKSGKQDKYVGLELFLLEY